ncbi:hypothetical protein NDU88_011865 [Pleurodeles waltl]|uniref:Uncharacterized protein n=1 Tax=Pleurodeles waltl TaxID=8319 RepID=A0AAV7R2Y0_PLEWA|nr:hypothetical protein NDU88_011865 [Pleurodeles waltl]
MLLYPGRLKVLSGGRSHFFEHREEVWRWLEIWDKVTLGRSERTGGVAHRASEADGKDWRTRGGSQLEGTVAQMAAADSAHRIEIQQDGTMAVVTAGSANGSSGELEWGTEKVSTHV